MIYKHSWTQRYRYTQFSTKRNNQKPKPYIDVTISNFEDTNSNRLNCKAILDSGSDRTLVPNSLLQALDAKPIGGETIIISGVNTEQIMVYECPIKIQFNGQTLDSLVLNWPCSTQRLLIIGRDILDRYCIAFDGCGSITEELHFYVHP